MPAVDLPPTCGLPALAGTAAGGRVRRRRLLGAHARDYMLNLHVGPYVGDAYCHPDCELQRLARPGTDCDRLNRHQKGPETDQVDTWWWHLGVSDFRCTLCRSSNSGMWETASARPEQ